MKKEKEQISNFMDMMLFWTGIAGKKINFKKVGDVYGTETAERLEREINAVRNAGNPHV